MVEQQEQTVTKFQARAVVGTNGFGTYENTFDSLVSQEDATRQAKAWAEKFARDGDWVEATAVDSHRCTFVQAREVIGVEVGELQSSRAPAPTPVEATDNAKPGDRLKRYQNDPTYRQLVDQARTFIRGACVHYDLGEVAGMLQLAVDLMNRERSARR